MNDNSTSRRRFPRYYVEAPFEANVQRNHRVASLHGRTLDLGEGGLGATIDGELSPGEVVRVRATFPDCALTFQPRAKVRYRNGNIHGFEFVNLSALQMAEVRICCRRLAEMSK